MSESKSFLQRCRDAKNKRLKEPLFTKNSVKNAAVTATHYVFGDIHFVMQSATDGVARAEASIVHRLTGELKSSLRNQRVAKTSGKQERIKRDFTASMKNVRATLVRSAKTDEGADAVLNSELS